MAVHYQSITGEKFELHVHDGNTKNGTKLTLVNQWTGVNQAVTPSLSSGHELNIRFLYYTGWQDAKVKFLITDDQGRKKIVLRLDSYYVGALKICDIQYGGCINFDQQLSDRLFKERSGYELSRISVNFDSSFILAPGGFSVYISVFQFCRGLILLSRNINIKTF